jgi:hypothetical protein
MTNEDRLTAREQRIAEEQAATERLSRELAEAEERIRLEPTLVLGNRTMPQMIEAERQRKADEALLEEARVQWAELQAAEEAAKAAKQAAFQALAEREQRGRAAPVRRRKLLRFALAVTAAPVVAAAAYAGVLAGSSLGG